MATDTLNIRDINCETLRVRGVIRLPDNALRSAVFDATDPVSGNKLLYLHKGNAADNYATAMATTFRRVIHVARGAGTVLGFRVTCAQPFVGDSTAKVEFYKNGTTLLTSDVDLNSTNIAAAYDIEEGVLVAAPGDVYDPEDVFEVAITTATVGTGTLGRGFYAEAWFAEEYNA